VRQQTALVVVHHDAGSRSVAQVGRLLAVRLHQVPLEKPNCLLVVQGRRPAIPRSKQILVLGLENTLRSEAQFLSPEPVDHRSVQLLCPMNRRKKIVLTKVWLIQSTFQDSLGNEIRRFRDQIR
jgi:hypothetical protein